MSSDFEVVFQGKVLIGADEQQVRKNIARMFKADDAKLATLFSGRTVVIKTGLDEATAKKYIQAMKKAGANAEIRSKVKETPKPAPQNPASFGAKDFSKPSLTSVAQAKSEQQAEREQRKQETQQPEEPPIGIPVPEIEEASAEEVEKAMASLVESQKANSQPAETEASSLTSQSSEQKASASPKSDDLTIAPVGSLILPDSKKEAPAPPSTDHLKINPMEGYLVEPEPEKPVKVPDTSHLKIKE
ncbi:hypothetical protein [Litoribacillus peritrichatus]|uniref:Uncharacterized protein n=1 Tax=Litoribacillus peritrichatus TaxID=718191 RepID=A0ABP7M4N8_9GAMM